MKTLICSEFYYWLSLSYYLRSKIINNNIIIISNDKFRWLDNNNNLNEDNNIIIRNFIFVYNCDESKIELKITKQDTHDILKIDNKFYILGYNNFPIIEYNSLLNIKNNEVNINENNFNIDIDISIENIKEILFKINYLLYKNIILDEKITINIINKVIEISSKIYNNLKIIFIFLKNNTKNSIFNYNINSDIIIIKEINIEFLKSDIIKYKIACETYIILKTINLKLYNKSIPESQDIQELPKSGEFTLKLCKLYSIIILIYDNIHDNLLKIRKLSNEKTEINKLFLLLMSTYLSIKKIGIFKKNI